MAAKMFSDERCYRPDEIAEVLAVDVSTVYRMIRDVERPLAAFRLGGDRQLRIWGRDANAYIEQKRVRPEEE